MTLAAESVLRALANARARLLDARDGAGRWVGELSSSALSTATAVSALGCAPDEGARAAARRGAAWLARHANADGGFGDTLDSPSNLATTALSWTALAGAGADHASAAGAAAAWLEGRVGALDAPHLADALAASYGADKTFAVPILFACAAGGAFGPGDAPWRSIPRLPFELAALPQAWFRHLGLPVVSYALPALIAVGQAIERRRPSPWPWTRLARRATRARTLDVLTRIQPPNGGFLEATPLTSFVLLALHGLEHGASPVATRARAFLSSSQRADGAWPIDTNLATWVTTLSIGALAGAEGAAGEQALKRALSKAERERLRASLLAQQGRGRHPYTGAAPGGFAWTELPGGVPDADDTAGALLALRALGPPDGATRAAAAAAIGWLCDLQNSDGGVPTFCRGWGKLPFDRSAADLTAHALRAFAAWEAELESSVRARLVAARARALRFLVRSQRADGAWVPLWFGNQDEARLENPLYGTSRVLLAADAAELQESSAVGADWPAALARASDWLLAAQGADGGFGGGAGLAPSVEETALALEALAVLARRPDAATPLRDAARAAAGWLVRATDAGTRFPARPIGLYFARLWYSERLYPLVFTCSALARARALLEPDA